MRVCSARGSPRRGRARRWRTTPISSTSRAPTRCCARGRSSRSSPSCGAARRSACTTSCRIRATSWTTATRGIARNADAISDALARGARRHGALPGDDGGLRHGARRDVRGAGGDHRARRSRAHRAPRRRLRRHLPRLLGGLRPRERLRRRLARAATTRSGSTRLRGDAPQRLEDAVRLAPRPARADRAKARSARRRSGAS